MQILVSPRVFCHPPPPGGEGVNVFFKQSKSVKLLLVRAERACCLGVLPVEGPMECLHPQLKLLLGVFIKWQPCIHIIANFYIFRSGLKFGDVS